MAHEDVEEHAEAAISAFCFLYIPNAAESIIQITPAGAILIEQFIGGDSCPLIEQ